MNFLSKNAPLKESIKNMQKALKKVKCETTFSQEKHPLKNCYSVNLASVEAPNHIYSNGKGIISDASQASALGEYIERLQTNNFFIDFHLPKRDYYPDALTFDFGGDYLNEKLQKIYNPNSEQSLEDLIDYNSDHTEKIVSLPFLNADTDEKVYFPLNILSNLYVSNGLATGNTPLEAKVQALSEIFERYAKMEIIKNGYALPSFPDAIIQSFDKLYEDITRLRDLGYLVEVLDASLGGLYPVTAISLINPKNSTLFVSFGAHPILQVSLERTMTELMQGRDLDDLDAFETPTFDMDIVSDNFNLEAHFIDSNGKIGFGFLNSQKSFDYVPWKYDKSGNDAEYEYLTQILHHMDKEIYLREYNYLGFYSCQVIVPGVSEIYPIDDMIYNNKNNGKLIRDMVLNFTKYDPADILNVIEALDDSLNIERYIGVIFQKNFTMLEFKAQIYILNNDSEEALWLLESSDNIMCKILAEIIRINQDKLIWSDYEKALYSIFTEEKVKKAKAILEKKDFLIDTALHTDYDNILSLFDRLDIEKRAYHA
ncbi:MAG: YcaO-like family protein [Sulfurospirillaceae bacterium]|nr:YcaO-like family protein [Sulfurospirillaceae bacterium]